MKAQLVFGFMIAVVVFFGIVLYVLNYLNGSVAGYSSDFAGENMQSKASQIGELLVLNKGIWSGSDPVIPGIAQEWPMLNSSKISWLNSSCNSEYKSFENMMGISYNKNIKITISQPGTVLADCLWGRPVPTNTTKAEAKRYALSESGNVLAVSVIVWCTSTPCFD